MVKRQMVDEVQAFSHLDQRWGTPDVPASATISLTEGPYRYVSTPVGAGRRLEELFSSEGDRLEARNLARENPELLLRFRESVRAHVEDSAPSPWGVEVETLDVDEINLDQLRALGYALPGA